MVLTADPQEMLISLMTSESGGPAMHRITHAPAEFDGVRFYSEHLGYDKGDNEVRVPRPVTGELEALQMLRSREPLYVIANDNELLYWRWFWDGTAYVSETLAKTTFSGCFNRDHRVVEDPCLKLVGAKHLLNDPLRKTLGNITPRD